MIRFIHAADIHLDSPLRGLERYEGAPIDKIRSATRRALERLVDLALERQVDFLVISGDLYDGDWRDYNTGLFLVRTLGRLGEAGIPVFVIAGNHDAANRMTRALRLPQNVRMLATDRPETVRVKGLDVAIHGQGFDTMAVTDDLSLNYPAPVGGCVNIGLLHTCMTGVEGHDRYAPCSVEGLRAKGYDYWALGHVHHRQVIHDDPPIIFPGNLQGRHVREAGPKGCLIVEIEPGQQPRIAFERLDVLSWELISVDVTDLDHPDDMVDLISQELRACLAREADSAHLLAVRVLVKGTVRWHDLLISERARWVSELQAESFSYGGDRLWVESLRTATTPPMRAHDTTGDGPIAFLERVIAQDREDHERLKSLGKRLTDLQRKLPVELFASEDAPSFEDPAWIRQMLDRAGPLLIHKLRTTGQNE